MGEEMSLIRLQVALRSLCFNTEWKYAVFWKLKHRTRMMLTWEDAYYNNHEPPDPSGHMHFHDTLKNLQDGRCLQDPLGLAVAKMSYLVYSLGEGIIGQVAVTGKHQWIFADKPASRAWSSSEYCDGWQTQFSAGIKTIAVVAVIPHGVVQLGSLNTVNEDVKLVTHIKDVFYSLQNSSIEFIPNPLQYTMQRTLRLSEASAIGSGMEIFEDFPHFSDKSICYKKADIQSHLLPSLGICKDSSCDVLALPDLHLKKAAEVANKDLGVESLPSRDAESSELHFFQPQSGILNVEQQKQEQAKLLNKKKCGEETSSWREIFVGSKHNGAPAPYNIRVDNINVDNFLLSAENSGVDYHFFPSDHLDSAVWDGAVYPGNEKIRLPEPLEMHLGKGLEQKSETEVSCLDTANTSLKFTTGCELHEALGPTFKKKQNICAWSESQKAETGIQIEPSERTASSQFTTECGSEYLLEAVVASACTGSSNVKSDNSLCKSAESLLTTGRTPQAPNHVRRGSGLASGPVIQSSLLVEDGTRHHLNSIWDSTEVCTVRSSKESSSKTLSTCSRQSEMQVETAKINRKRARPGESCRPRPRDRQLIQDRVKELRELVPNGSKCSIDSLLERTIKHMLFLQSVTKHAEKLKKCAESKLHDKRMDLIGSCSHEHGSSWALEVGNQTKVCPIVVENLNLNGQMLVEMLCEECNHFLEMAEAIRSLGLAILKGETEVRGEKTWACFVVEGQNNRSMHRMDILWSLMQLLQPKTRI